MPKRRTSGTNSGAAAVAASTDNDKNDDSDFDLPSDVAYDTDTSDAQLSSELDEYESDDVEEIDNSTDDEVDAAVLDYMKTTDHLAAGDVGAATQDAGPEEADGTGVGEAHDPGSDSSEDERPNRNTVGSVPLEWYKDEEHIGYNKEGKKIIKQQRGDQLDALLARNDSSKGWRTLYDEYNDEEIVLSTEEVQMIQRIREGRFPHVEVNPFEPEIDYFTSDREIHPLSSAPEPKRRFIPSKWEEKKIVRLVRALRKGWIKSSDSKVEEAEVYLMWEDDGRVADKAANGLSYVPAPKLKLPGHAESYRPPEEYIPTEEERAGWALLDLEDRPEYIPTVHESLRQVPAYDRFIKERFERCLDLYLCPRVRRKKRVNVEDPTQLLPKLPSPQELKPFPTTLVLRYEGHTDKVSSISIHPLGRWLASASADGTVRVWEVDTGFCMHTFAIGSPVSCVAWCPNTELALLAATTEKKVMLWHAGVGSDPKTLLDELKGAPKAAEEQGAVKWSFSGQYLEVHCGTHPVSSVVWHGKGDYFASVSPTGNTQAVVVHCLSKRSSQTPFRKIKGRVSRVLFHPTKPFFFVADRHHIRVYNLAKQVLAKKLLAGSGNITSLAIHPSGDHIIAGCEDKRLLWFDLDLSSKPYKVMRFHKYALRGVAYHNSYPLFASASDDACVNVFHGMVYSDLMTNPLIVPVKILRGHAMVEYNGVCDIAFHPQQPWLFSAGADHSICMFVDS